MLNNHKFKWNIYKANLLQWLTLMLLDLLQKNSNEIQGTSNRLPENIKDTINTLTCED